MSRLLGEQIRDSAVQHWVAHRGDQTLSIEHKNLSSESIVVDLGGYKGEWAKKIFDRYGCFLEIYEPASEFFDSIEGLFKGALGQKVKVFNSAAGSSNNKVSLLLDGLGTRTVSDENGSIQTTAIASIISNRQIDLLKMNIEGDEYDVLDAVFDSGLSTNIKSLFVQFHPIDDMSIQRYERIEQRLSRTHVCEFRYPFIWEKWCLK